MEKLKKVRLTSDELPALNSECLDLAEKITMRYRVPKALALRLFLPTEMRTGKVRELTKNYAELTLPFSQISLPKSAKNQQAVAQYLSQNGKTECAFLNKLYSGGVAGLEKKGYVKITKEQVFRNPYKQLEKYFLIYRSIAVIFIVVHKTTVKDYLLFVLGKPLDVKGYLLNLAA